MASPPPDVDLGKLSYEIFSLLESKFLFGGAGSVPGTPGRAGPGPGPGEESRDRGRVRVLSIDGCGPGPGDALLAAAALARLEAALRARAGDPDARVADFFDAAAGAGAGGVLAAMLLLRGDDGRARYTAADALAFVAASLGKPGGWGGAGAGAGAGGGLRSRWAALFRRGDRSRSRSSPLRRVFGDATLRDTVAPLLVPCYDLATAALFLFSRADAVESDSFDFRLRDVCAATCAAGTGSAAAAVRSVDGRTAIAAASGGVAAMGNPTAAAITHVLHNKHEFPLAAGVDDLLVVSIGSGSSAGSAAAAANATPSAGWRTPIPTRSPSPAEMVRLTAEGVADMVDQAVAMAFGHTCGRNYVRIQAASPAACSGKALRSVDAKKAVAAADGMLTQRNVEAELFRGRRLSEKSNREKLDAFAAELVKEQERRARSPGLPTVVIKQAPTTATPRPSSATTASSATATARTASTMPSPASQGSYQH